MRRTQLVDKAVFIGSCMDDGIITRADAIELLIESTGGTLTFYGAASMIDNHGLLRRIHGTWLNRWRQR